MHTEKFLVTGTRVGSMNHVYRAYSGWGEGILAPSGDTAGMAAAMRAVATITIAILPGHFGSGPWMSEAPVD